MKGVGGEWIIQFGDVSNATRGTDKSLPTMKASVNDHSRLWFGSASASAFTTAGTLKAEQSLIDQIDSLVHIPKPNLGGEF